MEPTHKTHIDLAKSGTDPLSHPALRELARLLARQAVLSDLAAAPTSQTPED